MDSIDIISILQMKKLRHTEKLSYLSKVLGPADRKARTQRQGLMLLETLCHLLHDWVQQPFFDMVNIY